jgi:hypothetical protein
MESEQKQKIITYAIAALVFIAGMAYCLDQFFVLRTDCENALARAYALGLNGTSISVMNASKKIVMPIVGGLN